MAKPGDNSDPLDKLSERLYRPSTGPFEHEEKTLHRPTYDAARDWNREDADYKPYSYAEAHPIVKKLFLGSAAFFLVSVVVAIFMFYGGGNVVSNDKIALSIVGPAFAEGGSDFQLEFHVKNSNSEALELAEILIEYPKGATLEGDKEAVRLRRPLGTVPAGRSATERVTIVLFGEEGSERTVKATLEYRVKGSNAIFVKEGSYLVHIKSSPTVLTVTAPKETSANQEFSLGIETVTNADKVVEGALLKVEYPAGFIFASAVPTPTYGNNVWRLGDLARGSKKNITLRGTLSGEDGAEYSFRVYLGAKDPNDDGEIGTIYNSALETIVVRRPFLEGKLFINDDQSATVIVSPTGEVKGRVNWANNLPNRVLDAEIRIRFVGSVLDRSSVSAPGGFWNSNDGTLVWNRETAPSLASLEGGDNDAFSFSFRLQPLFASGKVLFKNPSLSLEVTTQGRRLLDNNLSENISSSETKTVKVNTNAQFTARALYRDGPIANSGGLPPHAGRETTYAVSWSLLNSANDLSGVSVKTKLPPYVRFTKSVSPSSEDVTYDEVTREVTWNVGRLPASTGVTGLPKQAYFQIGLTPSLSQVDTTVPITGDMTFDGRDDFTGAPLSSTRAALTTRLTGDSGFAPGNDIIQR